SCIPPTPHLKLQERSTLLRPARRTRPNRQRRRSLSWQSNPRMFVIRAPQACADPTTRDTLAIHPLFFVITAVPHSGCARDPFLTCFFGSLLLLPNLKVFFPNTAHRTPLVTVFGSCAVVVVGLNPYSSTCEAKGFACLAVSI